MRNRRFRPNAPFARRRMAGFSLVELMTAMLLSLLLIGATVSVFMSNRRVYTATEGMGRLQENARIAFELMARDIREGGGNPCDVRMRLVSVLADTTDWWSNYTTEMALSGFDNGAHPDSVDGTDAIRVQFFEDLGIVTSAGMGGSSGSLVVNDIDRIAERQILMVCGFFPASATEPVTDTAAIFSAGKSGGSIVHDEGSGNIGSDFSNAAHPTAVVFPAGSLLGSLRAIEWYVGTNEEGRNSLYRRQLQYPGTAPVMGDPEEVVTDVVDMQLTYLENDTWSTGLPSSWNNVTAVRIALELEARDSRAGGVEGENIRRRLTHMVALRNRL